MAMSLSPLSEVSDIQSTPSTINSTTTPQEQMPPPTITAPTTASSPTSSPTQMKRKPSRRANTAERRATHNAVERQRRETLNGRFLDLASLLPNLSQIRRPSKSSIVNSSIAYIHASRRHHLLASRELRLLKSENDHLRFEINEWRDRAGMMRVEEPVRGEGFSVVISGQMEVVQATLKGGSGASGPGRGRRGRDGEEGEEDEDEGEEGEGEDGMIGLGGYGGSYMDDVEDDVILDGVNPLPNSFSMPSSMHLHHVHQQQQQMAMNAAIHHSQPPLEDMDDPRLAGLLLKNGGNTGFTPTSNFGFQQQQQLPYQQQYQQFTPSYLADKLWEDPRQTQYAPPPPHHQMMQPQQQPSGSLFPHPETIQYHPNLSINTGGVNIPTDLTLHGNTTTTNTSSMRGMAIKTKVANAKANARVVKASSNHGHSHSHSHSSGASPQSCSSSNGGASPPPLTAMSGGSPLSAAGTGRSPPHFQQQQQQMQMQQHLQQQQQQQQQHDRSTSRSGSESGSSASPPPPAPAPAAAAYELHSVDGDYTNANVPRMDHHHVGYMGLNGASGGMNGMVYGGPGHGNSNAMMMMMI